MFKCCDGCGEDMMRTRNDKETMMLGIEIIMVMMMLMIIMWW